MATDVIMPQMGESIAEGTITKWLAKVGDKVERDQPLFEISTDKVDAEIPSPADGVLLEISHGEGETVEVNQIVARIGEAGEQPAAETPAPAAVEAALAAETVPEAAPQSDAGATPSDQPAAPGPYRPPRQLLRARHDSTFHVSLLSRGNGRECPHLGRPRVSPPSRLSLTVDLAL